MVLKDNSILIHHLFELSKGIMYILKEFKVIAIKNYTVWLNY